jgi:uncharacterized membrane protein YcaP (DUF421 family)
MYNNNINGYNYYPPSQPIYNQAKVNPNFNVNQCFTYSQPMVLKGRPVTSLDEVRAASIEFDGSIFYFPDLANHCIYTKQINNDGTASINLYELKQIPVNNIQSQNVNSSLYVTREEFESVINKLQSLTYAHAEPAKTEIKAFN